MLPAKPHIDIRLSTADHAAIDTAAQLANMTPAAFSRRAAVRAARRLFVRDGYTDADPRRSNGYDDIDLRVS